MKPNLIRHIAFSSVVLASALICHVNTGPDSFARQIVSTFIKGENPHWMHLETDTLFKEAAPEGNVLLRFIGFNAEHPDAPKAMAAFIYYRSGYTLYPGKVFVGDRTTVINSSTDVVGSNFDPDEEWMDRNDIRSVVKVEYGPKEGIQFRIEKR